MAAKVPGALRLLPEKWARVDAYAKARGVSRQRVLESAVDSFLEAAQGGVSELPEVRPVGVEMARGAIERAAAVSAPNPMAGRQARLNREMGWSR